VEEITRRGFALVLASPSGAGKTTLSRLLSRADQDIQLVVSSTTRPKRLSEIDGEHYHFVSYCEFCALRDTGAFLECAEVHGHYYGTPKKLVTEYLNNGKDVLLAIDWQGVSQIYSKMSDDVVSILVLPPTMSELARRLRSRGEDNEEVIKSRLSDARVDIAKWQCFDYVIVNRELKQTGVGINSILQAERLRRKRVVGLDVFISSLLQQNSVS